MHKVFITPQIILICCQGWELVTYLAIWKFCLWSGRPWDIGLVLSPLLGGTGSKVQKIGRAMTPEWTWVTSWTTWAGDPHLTGSTFEKMTALRKDHRAEGPCSLRISASTRDWLGDVRWNKGDSQRQMLLLPWLIHQQKEADKSFPEISEPTSAICSSLEPSHKTFLS